MEMMSTYNFPIFPLQKTVFEEAQKSPCGPLELSEAECLSSWAHVRSSTSIQVVQAALIQPARIVQEPRCAMGELVAWIAGIA